MFTVKNNEHFSKKYIEYLCLKSFHVSLYRYCKQSKEIFRWIWILHAIFRFFGFIIPFFLEWSQFLKLERVKFQSEATHNAWHISEIKRFHRFSDYSILPYFVYSLNIFKFFFFIYSFDLCICVVFYRQFSILFFNDWMYT